MNEVEIWRVAEELRKCHGADAADEAGRRADKQLHAGDFEGFKEWVKVMAAVNELDRTKPKPDEFMN